MFKGTVQRDKCSIGWLFRFRLHLICNERGDILNFILTHSNMDDRKHLEYKSLVGFIYGKLVSNKGHIGKCFWERLFVDSILLITQSKSYIAIKKEAFMSLSDKLLLRERAIIETVNDELKNIAEHYFPSLREQ